MSAADEAREMEVEVAARAIRGDGYDRMAESWRDGYRNQARAVLAALEPIRAAERQEAAREALRAAADEVGAAIRDDHPNAGYRDGRDRAVMILRDRADGVAGRRET